MLRLPQLRCAAAHRWALHGRLLKLTVTEMWVNRHEALILQAPLVTFIALYLIVSLRYVIFAGAFYLALWKRDPIKVKARKLTAERPSQALIWSEIRWSLLASLIYALPGLVILEAWRRGGTRLYTELSDYGWLYLVASVLLYLFLHDTYFYWTHRLMHRPRLFRVMHRVHHQSRQPTPWTAFSFHPYESIIGAVIIPCLVFIIPIHVGGLLFILTLMTVSSVVNHTGFELLPDGWLKGIAGRHVITAAHHNLHHQRYACNYGLYFRFWDKLMGTDIVESAYDFLQPSPARRPTAETPSPSKSSRNKESHNKG